MKKLFRSCIFLYVLIGLFFLTNFVPCVTAQREGASKVGDEQNASPAVESSATQSPRQPAEVDQPKEETESSVSSLLYISVIVVACLIGVIGLTAAGVCWYRHKSLYIATERILYRSSDSSILIHNNGRSFRDKVDTSSAHTLSGLAQKTDYPAYGVTGPNPLHEPSYEPAIDGTLNRSAEVFHYNQTKKRMKALSNSATSDSGSSSHTHDPQDVARELDINDEETSDGEYTVYECSGLASTTDGPMEIRNPLFDDMPSKTNSNGTLGYHNATNYSDIPKNGASRQMSQK